MTKRTDALKLPPQATNDVWCRGETLAPILWQGRQWAVTEYGIEARDGCYTIESRWFRRNHHRMEMTCEQEWVEHMRHKGWVEVEDFEAAVVAFNQFFDARGLPSR